MKKNRSEDLETYLQQTGEDYEIVQGSTELVYLATLVSPLDHRVYDVVSVGSSDEVYLTSPLPADEYSDARSKVVVFGKASLAEPSKDLVYDTPSGEIKEGTFAAVGETKGAQALLLLSALAVKAVYNSYLGVYSAPHLRSPLSEKWWEQQVESRFVQEIELEEELKVDADFNVASEVDVSEFEELEDEDYAGFEWKVQDVEPEQHTSEVTLEGTLTVQALTAEQVAASGMVLSWNNQDGEINDIFEEYKEDMGQPTDVLLELDLTTTRDPQVVRNLWNELRDDPSITEDDLRAFSEKIPREFLESERAEWEADFKQIPLPFPQKKVKPNKGRHSSQWNEFFGPIAQSS